ncbi:putative cation transporting ATPase [Babesia divergens]|uniref:Cation transporting ATPase n=1 Tax=Babesia divergens TaxID=32595 RepID=A0AAD9G9F9_BABDI|nr:putative cation transporting ATPase [Babesia divergens]
MSTTKHSCGVYRYMGTTAPFVRFSLSVLAIAVACCGFHARKIVALIRGATDTVRASVEEIPEFDTAVKGIRVDFGEIARRINDMSAGETFLLVLFVIICLLGVILMLSMWYMCVKLAVFYAPCPFIEGTEEYRHYVVNKATHVYITEAPSSGDMVDEKRAPNNELVALQRSRYYTFYCHGHRKYILDDREFVFVPVEHIDSLDLAVLGEWRGLRGKCEEKDRPSGFKQSVAICEDWFGDNDYAIPACNFRAMLLDSFLSPFFLFQLFSTLLWVMDSYWYYSLLSICSIVSIEVQMVKKRIRDYDRINAMRIPPKTVHVYRDMKWTTLLSANLYPGDIFLLTHDGSNSPSVVPADCLILSGDVVVDESILTGESVPQFKSALDISTLRMKRNSITSNDSEMRQSTVFAGTSVMVCRSDGKSFGGIKLPKPGSLCLVLRTGFESYQGRLVNAIMHSGDRVTASTTEGWCFLSILLVFALVSCAFVVKRLPTASLKKLILTMLHIITSVIPPEFPVILSMAVTIAILQLHKKGVFCTEPFRVPYAGKLDVCAFDKTGTLTEDQMKVAGVVCGTTVAVPGADAVQQAPALPIASALVIGGCHSLSRVSGAVVGDPMEKASFEYFGWSLANDNKSVDSLQPWFYNASNKLAISRITVLRRWQFLSELGRMSTIVSVKGDSTYWRRGVSGHANESHLPEGLSQVNSAHSTPTASPSKGGYTNLETDFDGELMLLCKGAPEHLRPLLNDCPEYYDALYQTMAIGGMRVLALACKRLSLTPGQISTVERDEAERGLEFVGFLALESPIKPSSVQCMRQLEGHKLIMITGDNVLTACHVANTVEIGDRTEIVPHASLRRNWGDFAILVPSGKTFIWRRRDGEALAHTTPSKDFVEDMYALKNSMRLCVTGPAIDGLLEFERVSGRKVLAEVVLNATVFARVSPQQKEFVIRTFKRAGKKTAMCGDGTNDMAALKAAHVGISLLKSAFKKEETPLATKLSGIIRKQGNNRHRETLEQLQRELQDDIPELKLGEASIASPFTYRRNDVLCVPLLVRNGRCTLTNVVLLYKVMGINSVITSLGMSVLAMDGVNLSDAQTTLYSLMYTCMLMALSKSKPAQVSSCKRPKGSVFSLSNFTSLVCQCCLHIGVVLYLWTLGKLERPDSYVPNLDTPFEPNLVNTLVYYACFVVNLSGFLANYQGYPYTQPLRENKLVYRMLMASVMLMVALVCDIFSPLREYFSLVAIPNNALRVQVLFVLAADLFAALGIEHFCRRFLAW